MSNYITIESGYYEPFKENETDPELKIWADKYYEIIKRIHEVLLPYNENFEHFVELENRIDDFSEKSIRSLAEDDIVELKEELRKCLLHRVWKVRRSMLINESNVFCVSVEKNIFGYIMHIRSGMWKASVYPFRKPTLIETRDQEYVTRREDSDTFGMTYSIFEDIKSKGTLPLTERFMDLYYFLSMFADISTKCSIIETYKDFQSGNIDKIINDKIKCGNFKIGSDFHCNY